MYDYYYNLHSKSAVESFLFEEYEEAIASRSKSQEDYLAQMNKFKEAASLLQQLFELKRK